MQGAAARHISGHLGPIGFVAALRSLLRPKLGAYLLAPTIFVGDDEE